MSQRVNAFKQMLVSGFSFAFEALFLPQIRWWSPLFAQGQKHTVFAVNRLWSPLLNFTTFGDFRGLGDLSLTVVSEIGSVKVQVSVAEPDGDCRFSYAFFLPF